MPKQITIERFATRFQLAEKQPDEAGRFAGIASVWGSPIDTTWKIGVRTKFERGAFMKTIADWKSSSPTRQRIKILSAHDQEGIPIGLPTSIKETDEGLEIIASLNQSASAKDWMSVIQHAKSLGRIDELEMSIGFDPINAEMREDDDGEMFRHVLEARLWEASLVTAGADRQSRVLEAASLSSMRALTPEAFERDRQRQLAEIEAFEQKYGLEVEDEWQRIQRTYFLQPWER